MYDKLTLDYLGMLFTLGMPNGCDQVSIGMGKMMQESLNEVAVSVDALAESPAAHYLEHIDNECKRCQIMRQRTYIP